MACSEQGLEHDVLEAVLKLCGTKTRVERILGVDYEPAAATGENYLSVIRRLTVRLVLANGRTSKRSFFLKQCPFEEGRRRFVSSLGIFKQEITMYNNILREMVYLMDEFVDTEDVLWGEMLFHRPFDLLLLEDLKAKGYRNGSRLQCLDLKHSTLALRELARFHAMGKILEDRGILNKSDFHPYAVINSKYIINVFLYKGLENMRQAVEDCWGPAWQNLAQRLKIPSEVHEEKILAIASVREDRFNVLNHGDFWTNNILFRYDWQETPTSMRMIDFQVCHYNSPAWDLTYFLYTSVEPSIRRQSFDLLLRNYSQVLSDVLERYNYQGPRPKLEQILEEMERIAFFRVAMLTIFYATFTSDVPDPLNMEAVVTSGGAEGHNIQVFKNERYRQSIGPDLLELIEKGII